MSVFFLFTIQNLALLKQAIINETFIHIDENTEHFRVLNHFLK